MWKNLAPLPHQAKGHQGQLLVNKEVEGQQELEEGGERNNILSKNFVG